MTALRTTCLRPWPWNGQGGRCGECLAASAGATSPSSATALVACGGRGVATEANTCRECVQPGLKPSLRCSGPSSPERGGRFCLDVSLEEGEQVLGKVGVHVYVNKVKFYRRSVHWLDCVHVSQTADKRAVGGLAPQWGARKPRSTQTCAVLSCRMPHGRIWLPVDLGPSESGYVRAPHRASTWWARLFGVGIHPAGHRCGGLSCIAVAFIGSTVPMSAKPRTETRRECKRILAREAPGQDAVTILGIKE